MFNMKVKIKYNPFPYPDNFARRARLSILCPVHFTGARRFHMGNWSKLQTEQRNPATERIDEVSTLEMLSIINREDALVPAAVATLLTPIAEAVDLVASQLGNGGRLFYLGAGTSGRLGVLDAAECPPTFGANPELVQGLIAGGPTALCQAVEGAEDDRKAAPSELAQRGLGPADVVMGIAASGVTPFVLSGMEYAAQRGCPTIFFTCSPTAAESVVASIKIVPEVGPEVITGSTRMKAGTATKLVLNMISTGTMVKLGKTYGNLMVDLQPTNAKLRDRAERILANLTGASPQVAAARLQAAEGGLKLALVMELCQLDRAQAQHLLDAYGGSVKAATLTTGATPCNTQP